MECTNYPGLLTLAAQIPAIITGLWVFMLLEERADRKHGPWLGSILISGGRRAGAGIVALIGGIATWAVVLSVVLHIDAIRGVFLCP